MYDTIVCQVKPYLPYEMTHEGMLRRISAYIQHQDFCSPKPEIWPPLSSVRVLLSRPGQSCKDACWENSKCTVCDCSVVSFLPYFYNRSFNNRYFNMVKTSAQPYKHIIYVYVCNHIHRTACHAGQQ